MVSVIIFGTLDQVGLVFLGDCPALGLWPLRLYHAKTIQNMALRAVSCLGKCLVKGRPNGCGLKK
jgi:hypothetical protein